MTLETKRGRVPLEELCRLPSFYLPTPSWAGDRLAFYWDRTGRFELYVMDLRTRDVRQVSHGEVPRALRTGFVWDRAGRHIVFGRDVDGDEQHDLYSIDVETGDVVQLTDDRGSEDHAVEFSPDDEWLIVNTNKRHPDAPDVPGQVNLWKLRADGSEFVPLTRYEHPANGGRWAPDASLLWFSTNEDRGDLRNRDAYVIRPDGSEVRKLFSVRPGSQDGINDWHPDGDLVSVHSDASGQERVGILDVTTGDVRWLGTGVDEEYAGRFSSDGRWLLAVRNRDSAFRTVLFEVETGEERELAVDPGLVSGARFVLDDTKLVLTHTSDTTRNTLLLYDLTSDTSEVLLPAEYGSIDPAVFVPSEHVRYPSFDGTEVPALLHVPNEIADGERLPAIVYVHGGPTGQYFRMFDPFSQFLVDRGYVVLKPNIRGSTGYGVAFRDAALRDWGGDDLEDVAAGAEYLKSLPFVDPDRLVVYGGSYGGFMTFMAATRKPDLWRAAIAWVGISDLAMMYEESKEHFKYFLREQMGDPESNADLWADRSAINFAGDLRAKLLMIHGRNDPRCPVSQSRVFRDRLLELGRVEGADFDYVEFDDEGHGSLDIEQKIRTFHVLADWLEEALA